MSLRSTLPQLSLGQAAKEPTYSLDIVHGVARIGLGPLRAGPVRVEELLLEVAPLDYPFDLMALRAGLPERATQLGAINARVSDRHIRELLPGGLSLTIFPGRAFLSGPVHEGGRAVVEFVTDPNPPAGGVALKVASALRIGGSGSPIEQLLSFGSPGAMPDMQREPKEGRVVMDLLRWISGFLLCPMGWKVPVNAPDLVTYLILKEGMVHIEASHGDKAPTMELGAQPPVDVVARSRGREYAISTLSDIRGLVGSNRVHEAVERTGRHVAAAGEWASDLLVEASSFLPAIAVLPWARTLGSDFRLKVLEGNALLQQGDSEAAAEAWISAADQAGATEEPIYCMELLKAAFDRVENDARERERIVQRAYPILAKLMKRLPDERALADLVMSLGEGAPFDLRYRSLGSVLFAPKVHARDMERARQLLEEAVRLGHKDEGVEIATLLEARKGVAPELLFLCARAHDAGGNEKKAQQIWDDLKEAARARGREALHTACLVHLETKASDEEARIRLAGLERKVENQPFAMAAWLDRASRYHGFLDEGHVDKALALLERMPEIELANTLRKVASSVGFSSAYRCKMATTLLTHGLAQPLDLDDIDPELSDESLIRRLFRALRLMLKKNAVESLRVRGEALMGRILLHRYDRPEDARGHLQAAWDGGVRGRHLADDLARVFIDSGYPQAAQRILLTHLLSEQDPEDRVELGVHLLEMLPVGTPLLSELRTLLSESSRMVPWDERLRYLLEIRRGVADAEDWARSTGPPPEPQSLEIVNTKAEKVDPGFSLPIGTQSTEEPPLPPQREDVEEIANVVLAHEAPVEADTEELLAVDFVESQAIEIEADSFAPDTEAVVFTPEEVIPVLPSDQSTMKLKVDGPELSPETSDDSSGSLEASGPDPVQGIVSEQPAEQSAAATDRNLTETISFRVDRPDASALEPVHDEHLGRGTGSEENGEPSTLPPGGSGDVVDVIAIGRAETKIGPPPLPPNLSPVELEAEAPKSEKERHEEELGQIRKLTGVGAFDEARRRVRSLLKEAPDLSEAHVLLVVVAEAQGRLSEAVDHLLGRIDSGLGKQESRPLMLHALDLLLAAQRREEARVHLSGWLGRDEEFEESLTPPLKELLDEGSS